MPVKFHAFEVPRRLRAMVRAQELGPVGLAAVVGGVAGLVVTVMGGIVSLLHELFFGIPPGDRLSAIASIDPVHALVIPSLGGLLLGLAGLLLARWKQERFVDPIEANALHGGRMPFRGSLIVALQTVWPSGAGAPGGREAGYTHPPRGVGAWCGPPLPPPPPPL